MRALSWIKFSIRFSVLLAILLISSAVMAAAMEPEGILPPDGVVNQDLYLNAPSVLVQGQVNGMLVAIAQEVVIESSAVIQNDSFLVARVVTIQEGATFLGNLTIVAQSIFIDGQIQRNVYTAGAHLVVMANAVIDNNLFFGGYDSQFEPGGSIGSHLYNASYQIQHSGFLNKNLYSSSSSVLLDGVINGNAHLNLATGTINEDAIRFWMPYLSRFDIQEPYSNPFTITENAKVLGDLNVSGSADVEKTIQGMLPDFVEPPDSQQLDQQSQNSDQTLRDSKFASRLIRMIRLWVGLVLSAILALILFPTFFKISSTQIGQKPLAAIGIGAITLVSISIGLFLLAMLLLLSTFLLGLFSLGGLGRLLLGLCVLSLLWIGFVFVLIVMYGSKIVVAYWLGRQIMRQSVDRHRPADLSACVLGVTIFVLLSAIPYIGWLVSVMVSLTGLGGMWYANQSQKWLPFLKWRA